MRYFRYTIAGIIITFCISYGFYTLLDWGVAGNFQKDVDWLFWVCVEILQVWGKWTGLGYNLINILIFIILQPLLILIFFVLWRIEVSRKKKDSS